MLCVVIWSDSIACLDSIPQKTLLTNFMILDLYKIFVPLKLLHKFPGGAPFTRIIQHVLSIFHTPLYKFGWTKEFIYVQSYSQQIDRTIIDYLTIPYHMYMRMWKEKKTNKQIKASDFFLVHNCFLLLKFTDIFNQNFTCMAHMIAHSLIFYDYGTTLNMIFSVINSKCLSQY